MTRIKHPTNKDRRKLELLHQKLKEGDFSITCGCGENERCSECDVEITADDFHVFSHNADTLELRLRLTNIEPRSKLAQRYNYSVNSGNDKFADAVDWISNNAETREELRYIAEAVDRISAADNQYIDEDELVPLTKELEEI